MYGGFVPFRHHTASLHVLDPVVVTGKHQLCEFLVLIFFFCYRFSLAVYNQSIFSVVNLEMSYKHITEIVQPKPAESSIGPFALW
jgi:hypothetical protein